MVDRLAGGVQCPEPSLGSQGDARRGLHKKVGEWQQGAGIDRLKQTFQLSRKAALRAAAKGYEVASHITRA